MREQRGRHGRGSPTLLMPIRARRTVSVTSPPVNVFGSKVCRAMQSALCCGCPRVSPRLAAIRLSLALNPPRSPCGTAPSQTTRLLSSNPPPTPPCHVSRELFVDEYRVLLSDRLLEAWCVCLSRATSMTCRETSTFVFSTDCVCVCARACVCSTILCHDTMHLEALKLRCGEEHTTQCDVTLIRHC